MKKHSLKQTIVGSLLLLLNAHSVFAAEAVTQPPSLPGIKVETPGAMARAADTAPKNLYEGKTVSPGVIPTTAFGSSTPPAKSGCAATKDPQLCEKLYRLKKDSPKTKDDFAGYSCQPASYQCSNYTRVQYIFGYCSGTSIMTRCVNAGLPDTVADIEKNSQSVPTQPQIQVPLVVLEKQCTLAFPNASGLEKERLSNADPKLIKASQSGCCLMTYSASDGKGVQQKTFRASPGQGKSCNEDLEISQAREGLAQKEMQAAACAKVDCISALNTYYKNQCAKTVWESVEKNFAGASRVDKQAIPYSRNANVCQCWAYHKGDGQKFPFYVQTNGSVHPLSCASGVKKDASTSTAQVPIERTQTPAAPAEKKAVTPAAGNAAGGGADNGYL